MDKESNHISVCICTYKRPEMLRRLLWKVAEQETDGLFTFSIVVVDNDRAQSAAAVIREFAAVNNVTTGYYVEDRQGICLARNKAIKNADGGLIAFIDDDEFPDRGWLAALFKCYLEHGAAGVMGPVKSYFDQVPPRWVIESKFYERPRHPTGFRIDWREGRTGNVLLSSQLFKGKALPFDPTFHRGGDTDFFRRMSAMGHTFVWCDEAVVYEIVPPARWTLSFMLKRALLRGSITVQSPALGVGSIAKSLVAVPLYILTLTFVWMFGVHRAVDVLVRLCDHLGKLLTLAGLKPLKHPYVTD